MKDGSGGKGSNDQKERRKRKGGGRKERDKGEITEEKKWLKEMCRRDNEWKIEVEEKGVMMRRKGGKGKEEGKHKR